MRIEPDLVYDPTYIFPFDDEPYDPFWDDDIEDEDEEDFNDPYWDPIESGDEVF